ncbi:MAG: exodeoxyribonuclease V subunit gamma, partial [Acetatifactor sp.]|nr:exodeoxyribonuclease V subunit gamma [Acetatifactor sp.]
MSLKFVFGPSGSGKSRQIYNEITERAGKNPGQNFLIVVPDQFTMQTQKELVLLNDRGGIMNIDVLSFGRLNHRIMEEVGREEIPVLDDTGKSLVLQKVAANLKEELPVLGSFLHRQGYIHEVKSAISEFMQYGIGTEDVSKLIAYAGRRGALAGKLKDLETLYKGFTEYIRGNFITTEETLDVLRRSLHKSKLLPGSVVVFDGFTGFTPIQNRLIRELMQVCGEVILTVTLGQGENPYVKDGEQKLFYLSKKTVADLEKLAKEAGIPREKDVFIGTYHRFEQAPALRHLEKNLFRYPFQPYGEEQSEIRLFETTTPRDEVHQTGLKIRELVREQGLAYRDIAVIMGDLEGYAPFVETEFAQMEIPCFIDRTRGIALNPMIEFIKSALELFEKNFTYEAVFHYLRSGMADLERSEIDELENYVIRTGIRGYRSYSRLFTHKTEKMEKDEEALERINHLRERMMEQLSPLAMKKEGRVKDYIDGLYDFLVQNKVQNKLVEYERQFEEQGQLPRAREYAQIYRLVMELLDQIYELLGEETIPLPEFREILEAGFGEIQVGTIPQNVDRVVVGDMERTRLKQVKVLFFLGVNDGNIPKNASKGGTVYYKHL